eukprot:c9406_g1_i3.p1 GENE.c9406_g1_i3~~c9406_g1_i3.p1  ORF type:complete len:428 (+),score=131.72 c9406_g1_i3:44-1285(+)
MDSDLIRQLVAMQKSFVNEMKEMKNEMRHLKEDMDDGKNSKRSAKPAKRRRHEGESNTDSEHDTPVRQPKRTTPVSHNIPRAEGGVSEQGSRLGKLVVQLDVALAQASGISATNPAATAEIKDTSSVVDVLGQIETTLLNSPDDRAILARNHSWWMLVCGPATSQHFDLRSASTASLQALAAAVSDRHKKYSDNKCYSMSGIAEWSVSDSRLMNALLSAHLLSNDLGVVTAAASLALNIAFVIRKLAPTLDCAPPPWSITASTELTTAVIECLRNFNNEVLRTQNPEALRMLLGALSHSNLSVAEAVMACIAPMATTLEVRKEIRKMKIHRKLWAFVIGEVASTDALVVRGCAVLQVLSQDQEVATELRDMDACFILSQLLNECPKPEYKYILKSLLTNLSQADTAHVTPVHP